MVGGGMRWLICRRGRGRARGDDIREGWVLSRAQGTPGKKNCIIWYHRWESAGVFLFGWRLGVANV